MAAKVKGSKISSKVAFVREQFGEDGLRALIDTLPESDRNDVSSIIDLRWYPIELYDRVLNGIVRVIGRGDEAILDRIGAH